MLVTDEEPSDGIEVHLPLIEVRSKRGEKLGGDGEEGHVLNVWIEFKAVAGNMVGIVVPFPPPDTYPGEAVPSEDLQKAVQPGMVHNLVVPRVVPDPPGLDPQEPHHPATQQVYPLALRAKNPNHARHEQHHHEDQRDAGQVALLLEEAHLRELVDELAIIIRDLRDSVVPEVVAGEEAVEVMPSSGGVVSNESVRNVLPRQVEQGLIAAGVVLGPLCDVVDLALYRDPQISRLAVSRQLLKGDKLPRLHRSETFSGRWGGGRWDTSGEKRVFSERVRALWVRSRS